MASTIFDWMSLNARPTSPTSSPAGFSICGVFGSTVFVRSPVAIALMASVRPLTHTSRSICRRLDDHPQRANHRRDDQEREADGHERGDDRGDHDRLAAARGGRARLDPGGRDQLGGVGDHRAMILALVVIAAVAVSKVGALNAVTTDLSGHDMVAQRNVLNIQSDVQRTSYLVTSHLYVHDGELATQDQIATEIAALTKTGAAELKGLKASSDEPSTTAMIGKLEAARAKFAAAVNTAVVRSRDETVRNVEERD